MSISRPSVVRMGIVGCHRGAGFMVGLREMADRVMLTAVYDPDRARAEAFGRDNGFDRVCDSFEQLIAAVDAVIIASPQQYHAPQAVFALDRNVHVLVEVPAAVSMAQAELLLAAARKSSAMYMLAENYCYTRPNVVVDAMVRRGVFGQIYYGESEYLHEMRTYYTTDTGEHTWRYYWHAGRDGHPYPTHNLGPLLDWFDDHISAVSCVGSGRHTDPRYTLQDTTLLLCRTSRGALLNVRLDFLSNRPQLLGYYALQGTEGVYESPRSVRDEPRVYIQRRTANNEWDPLEKYFDEFLPDRYKRSIEGVGHWGGDLWMVVDFLTAIETHERPRLDIYQALRMTLPGLVSELSIAQNGQWLAVPNPLTMASGIGVSPGREAPLS